MILKLFSKSTGPPDSKAQAPENTRIYAIGDIHGQLEQLTALQDKVGEDAAQAPAERVVVVYLGDYVDRGPQSKAVVDRLIDDPLEAFERIYLLGNHEAFLLQFVEDQSAGRLWLMNGGAATCCSYGCDPTMAPSGEEPLLWLQRELRAAIDERQMAFFEGLQLTHEEGDYYFAHAGIRPGVALDQQQADDLLWIREPFLSSRKNFGRVVVHGHTPTAEPEIRLNRIGIDTGACYGGQLTALVLEGETRRFLQV